MKQQTKELIFLTAVAAILAVTLTRAYASDPIPISSTPYISQSVNHT